LGRGQTTDVRVAQVGRARITVSAANPDMHAGIAAGAAIRRACIAVVAAAANVYAAAGYHLTANDGVWVAAIRGAGIAVIA